MGVGSVVRVRPEAGESPAVREARFRSWVEPHWSAMSRLATRMGPSGEGEDVLQEALAAAWASWSTYDPERGSPLTWLLAVTANKAKSALRHSNRAFASDMTALPGTGVPGAQIADLDLEAAIVQLSPRQRLAVELFYFLDLPAAEVAQVMGCSPGTVKSTLADARTRLRDALGDEY
jgi:RNA polymerase sigma factor (sigma-70 family)